MEDRYKGGGGVGGHSGVARTFQKGGHTGSNIIVVLFSPWNIEGCLLKKGLQRGGGHGHPRTPLATPLGHITKCHGSTLRDPFYLALSGLYVEYDRYNGISSL